MSEPRAGGGGGAGDEVRGGAGDEARSVAGEAGGVARGESYGVQSGGTGGCDVAGQGAVGSAALSSAPKRGGATGKRTGIRRITGSFWFNLVAAFVVLALLQAFVVKLYYVPSGSMQQTLAIGDRILVDRVSFEFGANPKPGDVVVFTASDLWGEQAAAPSNPVSYALKWLGGVVGVGPTLDHTLVKRVIAGPGQTVSCCDALGRVTVDGVSLDEPYIYQDYPFQPGVLDCTTTPESQRCFPTVTVPAGQYFVLGDHRSNSNDSIYACRGRDPTASTSDCLKMVGRADIVGRAFAVVLPPGHWRGL
ncbi:MAG: signal peptidase [Subtercola sp.]|nr:signal peptidase [Subtercola sp.]